MIRELVTKFSSIIAEHRSAVRIKLNLPVKVCFAPEKNSANLRRTSCDDLFLSGETTDLSETGIGFLVSTIRIHEKYLVGQHRLLDVEIDVGVRKISMQVSGRRYEKVGIHLSAEKYLIGAEIVNMNEEDRAAYEHYLMNGHKVQKVRPEFDLASIEESTHSVS